MKGAIESTNGSVQTYSITDSNKAPKGDNEILADDDILTVTSQDKSATDMYIISIFDTITFTVTNGASPVEGAVINIYSNDGLEYFINYKGDKISDLVTDKEGKVVLDLPYNDLYTYTITAVGYGTKKGSFTTGQPNSDAVTVILSPTSTNITTIRGKRGSNYWERVEISYNSEGVDHLTIEYPTTVGEVKGLIESTNGSSQTYSIISSNNATKGDNELVADGDMLTVISQDRTETAIYTMEVHRHGVRSDGRRGDRPGQSRRRIPRRSGRLSSKTFCNS
jgi:hypothetical protein